MLLKGNQYENAENGDDPSGPEGDYVTIQTSLKNFEFNKRKLHHQILLKNSGKTLMYQK